jgi:coenzyme F420-0:L-glutamate ligase/coenzyme F420-1:gamma-L-glutamate ligase
VPAAVVRGLSTVDDRRGSRPLVRPAGEDMFRLGTAEAAAAGRAALVDELTTGVAGFGTAPVPDERIVAALPIVEGVRFVLVPPAQASQVDALLTPPVPPGASTLVIVCVPADAGPAGWYAAGTTVERLRTALTAGSLAAAVLGGPATDPEPLRGALELPAAWTPVAALAVGETP